jgi:hypothetical protein
MAKLNSLWLLSAANTDARHSRPNPAGKRVIKHERGRGARGGSVKETEGGDRCLDEKRSGMR